MARFAPVAPTSLLRKLRAYNLMGDYHLLLAHDIDQRPHAYADLFGLNFRRNNPDSYIILDNSLIELGAPAPKDMLMRAALAVMPNVIVLPDYTHDMSRTIAESRKAYQEWTSGKTRFFYMGVPQGETFAEYEKCLEALVELSGVIAIGIPRNMVAKLGSRLDFTLMVCREFPNLDIHLLGFSDKIIDDITCAMLPFVKGIDSAVPLRMGVRGEPLDSPYQDCITPRGDYWERDHKITPQLIRNLNRVRDWIA